jgi:SLA1 homology domain 1, SHD1
VRRSMHSLIVALLCLTLFVDSAKACWWLRQHRGRSQVCRPAACPPASSMPCTFVTVEHQEHTAIFGDDLRDEPSDCRCGGSQAESAMVDHQAFEQVIEPHVDHEAVLEQSGAKQGTVEHAMVERAERAESVVVHGPTIVVDASQAQPAAAAPPATSVMAAANAEQPSPAAAQPMPVASSSPTALPTPAQEPIPDLKPATAQSRVAPASNEQLMLEPAAAAQKPTAVDQPVAPTTPMPAAVEDLAGGPDMKSPRPEPKEPNLFDLYDDEGDEDAPAAEAPAASPPEAADASEAETAEDSAAEATATEEPEMTEDDEAMEAEAKTEADDSESETAEPADSAEEPDAASEAEPEQAEADPAAAAWTVPNEPMRNWSDDSGTHHAQGWLVEVRTDRVRILKVNGRHTTVWTESLSAADRDYVSEVSGRLAAQQQGTSPTPSTTAGL